MIRSCFFATGLLAFSAPAQSAEYLLDLRASNDQVSRMFKGKEEVASLAGDTIAILLEPSATQDRLIRLTVALSNGGSTSVNFGPENVRLVYGEGRSVSMLTHEDMLRRERKRRSCKRWLSVFAAGLRGAANANAGDYSGTANVRSPRYGSARVDYSGTDNAAAQAAQQNANRQTALEQQTIETGYQDRLKALDSALQTTTVPPGELFGGGIQFEIPREWRGLREPVSATFEITAGGTIHRIAATIMKR